LAYTYDPTGLKGSPLFRARYQLGDKGQLKDESGAQVWLSQDEELTALIDLFGYSEGVAQAADALAIQFAQEPTEYKDEQGVTVKWSDRIATWRALAAQLRAPTSVATATPTGGGYRSGVTRGPDMRGFR